MAIYDRTEARRLREGRAWTLSDVSRTSGIDQGYLADFEAGFRWLPPDYAERLERVLTTEEFRSGIPPASTLEPA